MKKYSFRTIRNQNGRVITESVKVPGTSLQDAEDYLIKYYKSQGAYDITVKRDTWRDFVIEVVYENSQDVQQEAFTVSAPSKKKAQEYIINTLESEGAFNIQFRTVH